MDHLGSTLGVVAGGVPGAAAGASQADHIDPLVIRTGTLEIIATDPSQPAEQLRNLATHLSGLAVSSKVIAGDEGTRSAQVTMRIPAGHFDDARAQVRAIAKAVEQDTVEVRDVTREYVNQEASLRNSRAEEARYLSILKRATALKDVLRLAPSWRKCGDELKRRKLICVLCITRSKCPC
jgi:hypothetical protein